MSRVLSFANETITNQNINEIVAELNKADSDVILDLNNSRLAISGEALTNLASAIETSRFLTEVKMNNLLWSKETPAIHSYKTTILKSFYNNNSIRELDLTGWKLGEEAFGIVKEIIMHHTQMKTLILLRSELDETKLKEIVDALEQSQTGTITHLSLYTYKPRTQAGQDAVSRIETQCKLNQQRLYSASQESLSSANLTSPVLVGQDDSRAINTSELIVEINNLAQNQRFLSNPSAISDLLTEINNLDQEQRFSSNPSATATSDLSRETDSDTENDSCTSSETSDNSMEDLLEAAESLSPHFLSSSLPSVCESVDNFSGQNGPHNVSDPEFATKLAEAEKTIAELQEQLGLKNAENAAHEIKERGDQLRISALSTQVNDLERDKNTLSTEVQQLLNRQNKLCDFAIKGYKKNLDSLEKRYKELENKLLNIWGHAKALSYVKTEHLNDLLSSIQENINTLEPTRKTLLYDLKALKPTLLRLNQIDNNRLTKWIETLTQLETMTEELSNNFKRLRKKVDNFNSEPIAPPSPTKTTQDTYTSGDRSSAINNGSNPTTPYYRFYSTTMELEGNGKRKHNGATDYEPASKRPTSDARRGISHD